MLKKKKYKKTHTHTHAAPTEKQEMIRNKQMSVEYKNGKERKKGREREKWIIMMK